MEHLSPLSGPFSRHTHSEKLTHQCCQCYDSEKCYKQLCQSIQIHKRHKIIDCGRAMHIWWATRIKVSFCYMQKTKTPISLSMRAVWSEPSLPTYRINECCKIYWRTKKNGQTARTRRLIKAFAALRWQENPTSALASFMPSRKHSYIIVSPFNPTFIE